MQQGRKFPVRKDFPDNFCRAIMYLYVCILVINDLFCLQNDDINNWQLNQIVVGGENRDETKIYAKFYLK